MRKRTRVLIGIGGAIVLLIGGGAIWVRSLLVSSLPLLDGRAVLTGSSGEALLERDELGIPVIRGASLEDCLRGLGFAHAQDRFLQMDLARRRAAGELSELVGEAALMADRQMRPHFLRSRARSVIERESARRSFLEAYCDGVNDGLSQLGGRPPEYLLLRSDPEPWALEDTVLVVYAMFDLLSQDAHYEAMRATMNAALPEELVRFLTPESGRFDVPLIGGVEEDRDPLPIPGKEIVDLRRISSGAASSAGAASEPKEDPPSERGTREESRQDSMRSPSSSSSGRGEGALASRTGAGFFWGFSRSKLPEAVLGSNNFAVSGSRSASGRAILANDMHLPLSVPNVWYRAQLEWPGRRVSGLTLAGVPGMVAGSNGNVAWGFTNASGDFQDWVILELDPEDNSRYRTEDGWEPFVERVESIAVRDREPEEVIYQVSRWGTVISFHPDGRPMALQWTALVEEGVDFSLLDLLEVENLDEGLDVAGRWAGPPQNVLLADDDGRIGYVLSGYLPRREGFSGALPAVWGEPGVGWSGALSEEQRPRLADPEEGILYTANNRVASSDVASRYGRVWAPALRAARIAERLREKEELSEADLLEIQLDVRSRIHDFYRDLFLEAVAASPDSDLQPMAKLVEAWDGTASVDQPGFRLLRELRRRIHEQLIRPLTDPCREVEPNFRYRWPLAEEAVRELLERRPPHLLSAGYPDYLALVRTGARSLVEDLARLPAQFGLEAPWGVANQTAIRHPFSSFFSSAGDLLDMAPRGLPGGVFCVRVQGPTFGASERFVVSPGREEDGILHMPGGQSAHFLSPHYRDGHGAWENGDATPFLAGPAVHTLRFDRE